MRDTILPSAWIDSSSVRRPWMCEIAAPAFTASPYCCAQAAMSSCGGQKLLCGYEVRESPATVMISFSMSCSLHLFDLSALARPYHGVEHGHAVQHLVDGDGVGPFLFNAVAEFDQFGVERIERRDFDDLVWRRGDRPGRRHRRDRHEAEARQVWLGELRQALCAE